LALDQIMKEELPGDLAEIGVYRGETATLIATIARRLGKAAWLLDTFEGFDPRDLQGIDYGQNEQFNDTSLDSVRSLVGDDNVHFIKGYFPDTAVQMPSDLSYCSCMSTAICTIRSAPRSTIFIRDWCQVGSCGCTTIQA